MMLYPLEYIHFSIMILERGLGARDVKLGRTSLTIFGMSWRRASMQCEWTVYKSERVERLCVKQ